MPEEHQERSPEALGPAGEQAEVAASEPQAAREEQEAPEEVSVPLGQPEEQRERGPVA